MKKIVLLIFVLFLGQFSQAQIVLNPNVAKKIIDKPKVNYLKKIYSSKENSSGWNFENAKKSIESDIFYFVRLFDRSDSFTNFMNELLFPNLAELRSE